MADEDYIDVAAERKKGKQRGIDEAFIEGERIYNDGFSSITSGMNKQITKGLMYEKSAIQALERGYKAAKAKDKDKDKPIKKKSGGLLKAAPNKGVTKLPKDVRNKMGFMKKGGKVKGYAPGGVIKKMKKCRMDGIALRGKTRAKQRSK